MARRLVSFCVGLLSILLTVIPHAYVRSADDQAFITRSKSVLYNNGVPFKFAGTNMHWLGLVDFLDGVPASYPTQFMIDDAMTTAQEMGMTVVRSHTLGISVGCPNCIEPSLNQWNDAAFKPIDYAIQSAHNHHIRLIIPLVDNWHYYHGGKAFFTSGEGDSNEDDFFSNPVVINDFENYIAHLLDHVNQYTGMALKDDPTILAWETGNELATSGTWNDNWTQAIATYIKAIDPQHLVADGHTGGANSNKQLTASQLQNSAVDMYTDHFYPPDVAAMQANARLAVQYGKVYYVGEYDWTDQDATPAIASISQDSADTKSAKIQISRSIVNPANMRDYFYVQFQSNHFTLQAETPYTVSFYAKTSANNSIQVVLAQAELPYTVYAQQRFALTSSWQAYSFTFTPSVPLMPVWLAFNMGQDTGAIWLDTVSVSTGSQNLITNSAFDNGDGAWLSPWELHLYPGGDKLTRLLPAVENTPGVSGDLFWELYGHGPIHGYASNDVYTFHYPGDTRDDQNRAQLLRNHAFRMSGIGVLPRHITPAAPVINSIAKAKNSILVDWRGSAGAASYTLKQSTDGKSWVVVKAGLTDRQSPANIPVHTQNASYQLVPVSIDGSVGQPSGVYSLHADSSP